MSNDKKLIVLPAMNGGATKKEMKAEELTMIRYNRLLSSMDAILGELDNLKPDELQHIKVRSYGLIRAIRDNKKLLRIVK